MPDLSPSRYCVRTSGCRSFRRCLRKWGFEASLRDNLTHKGTEQNIHFWFGTAIHYAMEDYFGYNRFGDPRRALKAYYDAFAPEDRPNLAEEHYALGISMLDYFLEWYPLKNAQYGFQTVWITDSKEIVEPHTPGAHPLCEEQFMLDLGVPVWVDDITGDLVSATKFRIETDPNNKELGWYVPQDSATIITPDNVNLFSDARQCHIETIKYHGTCDRIVADKNGDWWILDYKTAKSADTGKLDTDDQITRYLWAMEQWFQRSIKGFIYLQLTKSVVKEPKVLANGNLSTDKRQSTTALKYRAALEKHYGDVRKAPAKMVECLNNLRMNEDVNGDKFIRWDLVQRSRAQKISTYEHIVAEVMDMVNIDRPLYPTPTRDCVWDCSFREACLLMEDKQEDALRQYLTTNFEPRKRDEDGEMDPWRASIRYPEGDIDKLEPDWFPSTELDDIALNVILPDNY